MEISISTFDVRATSDTLDQRIAAVFQQGEEITVTELGKTYTSDPDQMVQLKSDIQEYYASKETKPRLSIPKKQNASKSIYCNRPYKVAESHKRTVSTRKNINKKLNKNISNLESWKSGLNALMVLSLIFAVLFAILLFTGGEIQVAISCLGLAASVFSLSRIMAGVMDSITTLSSKVTYLESVLSKLNKPEEE
jgi:hypothetical protein